MGDRIAPLLDHVLLLATELPAATVREVARELDGAPADDWGAISDHVRHVAASARYRSLSSALIDTWRAQAPGLAPGRVAAALLAAARCREVSRAEQVVELVWTGPDSGAVPFRRTEDALIETIEGARERLTVVSFALYKIPHVRNALVASARRGVKLRLIVESPEASEDKLTFDGLHTLGREVAQSALVYVWPREKRPTHPGGRYGSLHAKCAVADGSKLFLSSANLTEFALTLNMEMGLLVRGGHLPRRVAEHFDGLIRAGLLVRVDR
jgi:phosphatidylserine/phosphatidylglycerophosphate/cardiolipin synthase-like enzyme